MVVKGWFARREDSAALVWEAQMFKRLRDLHSRWVACLTHGRVRATQ